VVVVVDGAGSVGAGGTGGASGFISAGGADVGAAGGGVSSRFTFFFARFALFFLFLGLGKILPHPETIADPR
jgi:hypothetical protein